MELVHHVVCRVYFPAEAGTHLLPSSERWKAEFVQRPNFLLHCCSIVVRNVKQQRLREAGFILHNVPPV